MDYIQEDEYALHWPVWRLRRDTEDMTDDDVRDWLDSLPDDPADLPRQLQDNTRWHATIDDMRDALRLRGKPLPKVVMGASPLESEVFVQDDGCALLVQRRYKPDANTLIWVDQALDSDDAGRGLFTAAELADCAVV